MTRPSVEPLLSFLNDDMEIARRRLVAARREMVLLHDRAQKARDCTEERADQAFAKTPPTTPDELRNALKRGRALTPRERRAVMGYWWLLPKEALKLSQEDTNLVPILRKELFRSFRHYKQGHFEQLVKEVVRFERRSGRRGGIGFAKWMDGGPSEFAGRLSGHPEEWADQARQYELVVRWDYTQFTFAARLNGFVSESGARSALGSILELPPSERSRFFPPDKGVSGFWDSPAAALMVAAWLDGARRSSDDATAIDGRLVRAMGDPRAGGDATHWLAVKRTSPKGYQALTERLCRADIEFFFGILGREGRRRGDFWLQYLRSIRSTDCFLCAEDDAAARARAAEPGVDLALARARRARGITSVFVMDFGDFVAVEFSKTGNATYIYSRRNFQEVNRSMDDRRFVDADIFKSKARADDWLPHSENWQSKFSEALARRGVFPDPDKGR